jgi:MFS family permease
MSGLTGGAPVFALLLAMVISVSIELSASAAFLGTSILAALLTLPVTWQTKKADSKSALIEVNQHDAHTAKLINSWWQFVLVAFLLSCTTSAANGYLYAYANTALGLKVDDATLFVTKLVLIASALSLIAGTIAGVVARRRHLTTSTYALGAVLVGAAVFAMAMAPSIKMAIVCAAVFGTGFGIANGLELSLFMQAKLDPSAAGKLLGIFTAATTLPYVLVPFIASWLLRSGSEFTILNLWTGAAVLAAGSALLAWRIKIDA